MPRSCGCAASIPLSSSRAGLRQPRGWAATDCAPRVRHSVKYHEPGPCRGKEVVVVGAGTTGMAIAYESARGGTNRVTLCFRAPPTVLPHTFGGLPTDLLVPVAPEVVGLHAGGFAARGGSRGQFNYCAVAGRSPRLHPHRATMHTESARERDHAHPLCVGCSSSVHVAVCQGCSSSSAWLRHGLEVVCMGAPRRPGDAALRLNPREIKALDGDDEHVHITGLVCTQRSEVPSRVASPLRQRPQVRFEPARAGRCS